MLPKLSRTNSAKPRHAPELLASCRDGCTEAIMLTQASRSHRWSDSQKMRTVHWIGRCLDWWRRIWRVCFRRECDESNSKMLTSFPQRITKLDAAERKLVAAIRSFFRNEDAIVVYSLAGDAAEVLDALCRKRGIRPFRDEACAAVPDLTQKSFADIVNRHRNFFKHARGDAAEEVLDDFTDAHNDPLLFSASYDLGQLCAALRRGFPVEAQMLQIWFMQVHRDAAGPVIQAAGLPDAPHLVFPDLHQRPRYEQKMLGREAITWARNEPTLSQPILPTPASDGPA